MKRRLGRLLCWLGRHDWDMGFEYYGQWVCQRPGCGAEEWAI